MTFMFKIFRLTHEMNKIMRMDYVIETFKQVNTNEESDRGVDGNLYCFDCLSHMGRLVPSSILGMCIKRISV